MQPDPAAPSVTPAEIAAETAGAIKDDARRLGLTWQRRMAEVQAVSAVGPQHYLCTYDGDSEPIDMICITGDVLRPGMRVYVDEVPPSGNYIVGHALAREFFAYKDATTSLTSDVFVTDPDLIVVVPPGFRFYTVEAMIRNTNSATGVGMKLALRGPANSRVSFAGAGPAFANTSNEGDGAWFAPGATTGLTAGGFYGASSTILTFPWGISVKAAVVTMGPGGRISWDMSQVINTPGNPTLILKDSWMTVKDQGPVSA